MTNGSSWNHLLSVQTGHLIDFDTFLQNVLEIMFKVLRQVYDNHLWPWEPHKATGAIISHAFASDIAALPVWHWILQKHRTAEEKRFKIQWNLFSDFFLMALFQKSNHIVIQVYIFSFDWEELSLYTSVFLYKYDTLDFQHKLNYLNTFLWSRHFIMFNRSWISQYGVHWSYKWHLSSFCQTFVPGDVNGV